MIHNLKNIKELIYPESCLHCHKKTVIQNNLPICINCELKLESDKSTIGTSFTLNQKFKGLINIKYCFSQFYFVKNGVSQTLIHEAKYQRQTNILTHYGSIMGQKIKAGHIDQNLIDYIVPIPNNWIKHLKLGYNQAAVYSSAVAKEIGIKQNTSILKKRFDRTSQTKRNKLQRLEHLSNLYYIKNNHLIKDKNILLIDDVITSGATIETCADLLIKSGVKSVSVLAFMVVK